MQYRSLGRTGLRVSEVGLGTEYLIGAPRERIISVIREAIANEINYFDLFCAEPAFRDAMGEAFAGQRDRVFYGAHLGAGVKADGQYQKTRSVRKAEQFFDDFLRRYNTDHVDVLFMHNCDSQKDLDSMFGEKGLLALALRLKEQNKARFIGFSGHTASTSIQAVESGDVDVLMVPISMAGHAAAGKKALFDACLAHNVGLVSMKAYGGGKLLTETSSFRVPKYLAGEAYRAKMPAPITPVQCLAYALSQPGVSTVVPGCANLDHLADALGYSTATDQERDFSDALQGFQQPMVGECVYCNHCLPCPVQIDIGQTIRLFKMGQQGMTDAIRLAYSAMPAAAVDCTQCGACEKRCPFGVSVIDKMAQAAMLFA